MWHFDEVPRTNDHYLYYFDFIYTSSKLTSFNVFYLFSTHTRQPYLLKQSSHFTSNNLKWLPSLEKNLTASLFFTSNYNSRLLSFKNLPYLLQVYQGIVSFINYKFSWAWSITNIIKFRDRSTYIVFTCYLNHLQ